MTLSQAFLPLSFFTVQNNPFLFYFFPSPLLQFVLEPEIGFVEEENNFFLVFSTKKGERFLLPAFILEELYQKEEKENFQEWVFWFVASVFPENEENGKILKKASYATLRLTQAELAKVLGFVEAKKER